MFHLRTLLGASAALLLAGAAQASEGASPDGPMATAGASGAPPSVAAETRPGPAADPRTAEPATPGRAMTTDEQIDAFIRSSPTAAPSPDEMAAFEDFEPERRVRGSFEVGVGSHGYRHAGVRAHYPVGKNGHVSVAVGSTRGRGVGLGCVGGPFAGPLAGPLGPFDGPACYAPW